MEITVHFYSYFKEMTGCPHAKLTVNAGSNIAGVLDQLFVQFPKLAGLQRSMLLAVGVDYQTSDYILQEGDELSLFPPVQGG